MACYRDNVNFFLFYMWVLHPVACINQYDITTLSNQNSVGVFSPFIIPHYISRLSGSTECMIYNCNFYLYFVVST
jgi:hypothetical protein